MIDHHTALIYVMVLASASDARMSDEELDTIGENVRYLPIFHDFDRTRLNGIAASCTELLGDPNGLDTALELIKNALPTRLCETAYAVACDIVAADAQATQEELRLLEILRHKLNVDRLCAAAIERGARARHARL